MNQSNRLSPESSRIDLLDIYRGFAIFGIFVVNIEIMNCIPLNQDGFYTSFQDVWNRLADEIRRLFFYSKFFPIFSLLFGLGIAMQVQKRKHLSKPYRGFIRWRMFTLLLIGIGHIVLLWSGDVVHMYAIIGFFIPFIHRFSMRRLLIASALILLGFTELGSWVLSGVMNLLAAFGFDPTFRFEQLYPIENIPTIIGEGSYAEGVRFRIFDYFFNLPLAYSYFFPLALSMIILGVAIGKSSFLRNPRRFLDQIKKPVLLIAVISNLYRLFFLYVVLDQGWHRTELWGPFLLWLMPVCDVIMGLFYLWLVGWAYRFVSIQKLLKPLTYVGKMALSNYLLQSFFGLILFTGVGYGGYMEFSQWDTLIFALGFFLIQIIWSKYWLKTFRFGPLEWVWRCVSYKRYIPIRLQD